MNIGILTFHAAYNYGAVLQAYALQQCLEKLDYKCKIIDYRTASQEDFNALYPKRNGIKSFFKNCLMIRYDSQRRTRKRRFDEFLDKELKLTSETYLGEQNLYELNKYFDCFVTGSDQVWNVRKKADVKPPYFLDFVDNTKRKIAYAVSIGNSTIDDLESYVEFINDFDGISCREKNGKRILDMLCPKGVKLVLDPTLLIDNSLLKDITSEERVVEGEYIFYYSLDGFDLRKRNVDLLKYLKQLTGKKIIVLTPEWPKKEKEFVNVVNPGPKEFLNLIANASLICTNSFHGTALSISFQKDFIVLEKDGVDDRKTSILEVLELENRKICEVGDLDKIRLFGIDYESVNIKLEQMRSQSWKFIRNSIENGEYSNV